MSSTNIVDFAVTIQIEGGGVPLSLGWVRDVAVVCKPIAVITQPTKTLCTSKAEVQALTDSAGILKLFDYGLNKVYVVLSNDLSLSSVTDTLEGSAYTLLISKDFLDADLEDIDVGSFGGVKARETTSLIKAQELVVAGYHSVYSLLGDDESVSELLAKLLSSNFYVSDGQYIEFDKEGSVTDVGLAEALFEDGVSFIYKDLNVGNRLGYAGVGLNHFSKPYTEREISIILQNAGFNYITVNKPKKTQDKANMVALHLEESVVNYVNDGIIGDLSLQGSLSNERFTIRVQGELRVLEPIWRIQITLRESL